jgi:hypothetical protein
MKTCGMASRPTWLYLIHNELDVPYRARRGRTGRSCSALEMHEHMVWPSARPAAVKIANGAQSLTTLAYPICAQLPILPKIRRGCAGWDSRRHCRRGRRSRSCSMWAGGGPCAATGRHQVAIASPWTAV